MAEWCIEIRDMFLEFVGSGWLHWLAAVIVLVAGSIKNKYFRHKFLYPILFLLAVFFCPVVYGTIGIRFMNGMYWRILWLVPVTVIIGYGGVKLCMRCKSYVAKAVLLAAVSMAVALSGKPMFSQANYYPAQNIYQLPQGTINVADVIISEITDERVKPYVVVPDEVLCSMRQYTTKIRLLYGRDAYAYIFNELSDMKAAVHNEMVKAQPDVETLAKYAKAQNVEYIVFNSHYHVGTEGIKMHGYDYFKSVSGYDIYRVAE